MWKWLLEGGNKCSVVDYFLMLICGDQSAQQDGLASMLNMEQSALSIVITWSTLSMYFAGLEQWFLRSSSALRSWPSTSLRWRRMWKKILNQVANAIGKCLPQSDLKWMRTQDDVYNLGGLVCHKYIYGDYVMCTQSISQAFGQTYNIVL